MTAPHTKTTPLPPAGELEDRKAEFRATLDSEFDIATAYKANKADWLDGRWSGLKAVREDEDDPRRGRTGVPADTLREIGKAITTRSEEHTSELQLH